MAEGSANIWGIQVAGKDGDGKPVHLRVLHLGRHRRPRDQGRALRHRVPVGRARHAGRGDRDAVAADRRGQGAPRRLGRRRPVPRRARPGDPLPRAHRGAVRLLDPRATGRASRRRASSAACRRRRRGADQRARARTTPRPSRCCPRTRWWRSASRAAAATARPRSATPRSAIATASSTTTTAHNGSVTDGRRSGATTHGEDDPGAGGGDRQADRRADRAAARLPSASRALHKERRTAEIIAERLHAAKLEVRTGVARHRRGRRAPRRPAGRTIAWRADIDALPLTELLDAPFASGTPGVMHACGHDGHTAIAITLAEILAARRAEMPGTAVFIFQPAEEVLGGARPMIEAGVLDEPARRGGLRAAPHHAACASGQVQVRPGPIMASADAFSVEVRGAAATAPMPHLSVDPITAAANILLGMQSLVAQRGRGAGDGGAHRRPDRGGHQGQHHPGHAPS